MFLEGLFYDFLFAKFVKTFWSRFRTQEKLLRILNRKYKTLILTSITPFCFINKNDYKQNDFKLGKAKISQKIVY